MTRVLPRPKFRRGGTLLEVTIGITLLTVLLIPSMQLVRDASFRMRDDETTDILFFHAENEVIAAKADVYAKSTPTRLVVRSVNDPVLPSITTRRSYQRIYSTPLVEIITVDCFHDTNTNQNRDAGESVVRLTTLAIQP